MDVKKIFNHLILNIFYLKEYGLYYGKTGCLLFLTHYFQQYRNEINEEIVLETIDDIFSSINKIYSLDMERGVCGIGWGVEYILQNQLLEGDPDEILYDLDRYILNKDLKELSTHPDLTDVLSYIIVRLTSSCAKTNILPFPNDYLWKLHSILEESIEKNNISMLKKLRTIKDILEKGRFSLNPIKLPDSMLGTISITQFPLVPINLYNGLSGLGIKLLLNDKDE